MPRRRLSRVATELCVPLILPSGFEDVIQCDHDQLWCKFVCSVAHTVIVFRSRYFLLLLLSTVAVAPSLLWLAVTTVECVEKKSYRLKIILQMMMTIGAT